MTRFACFLGAVLLVSQVGAISTLKEPTNVVSKDDAPQFDWPEASYASDDTIEQIAAQTDAMKGGDNTAQAGPSARFKEMKRRKNEHTETKNKKESKTETDTKTETGTGTVKTNKKKISTQINSEEKNLLATATAEEIKMQLGEKAGLAMQKLDALIAHAKSMKDLKKILPSVVPPVQPFVAPSLNSMYGVPPSNDNNVVAVGNGVSRVPGSLTQTDAMPYWSNSGDQLFPSLMSPFMTSVPVNLYSDGTRYPMNMHRFDYFGGGGSSDSGGGKKE